MNSSLSQPNHFFFCSSLPATISGNAPRWLHMMLVLMPAQPNESSSLIRQPSRVCSPSPPYSSGISTFIRPSSQASLKVSTGNLLSSSHSPAKGMIRSAANLRAVSISCFCSSV